MGHAVDEMPFPENSHLNQPVGLETIGPLGLPMLGDKLHAVRRATSISRPLIFISTVRP